MEAKPQQTTKPKTETAWTAPFMNEQHDRRRWNLSLGTSSAPRDHDNTGQQINTTCDPRSRRTKRNNQQHRKHKTNNNIRHNLLSTNSTTKRTKHKEEHSLGSLQQTQSTQHNAGILPEYQRYTTAQQLPGSKDTYSSGQQ